MKRQRFLVNVIHDPEYKRYVVDVPQLPGCISQGKTIESALANSRKAITAYLKAAWPKNLPEVPEIPTSQA
ncbi:MAG: type II toxin-antitoxin system HicB family antitoxin [Terriglobia bacterium]